jgi:endoglucanase
VTTQTVLPRWRGFNLLEFFGIPHLEARSFREDDFRWIAGWGFDFVRIPMNYLLWLVDGDPYTVDEAVIEKLDAALEYGERYHIHVSLNFHTAPGYRIGAPYTPPGSLWKDQIALDAFCFHWEYFARRYKSIPSSRLSFDLVNEPPPLSRREMTLKDYIRVHSAAVHAIRAIDADRLIIANGYGVGRKPCFELAPLGIAQSARAYDPHSISHYRALWANGMHYPRPQYPQPRRGMARAWNRQRLEALYQPWVKLAQSGIGVHCGEGGAYKHTPHDVFLAWFGDVLDILTVHNIGYALWNFRGDFGILDSGRSDVAYADWHGHQLDEKLLRLLQAH